MPLTPKEELLIQDLQSQEKLCIEKYQNYANSAKDPELKKLFNKIKGQEQEHFDSLSKVLNDEVPPVTQLVTEAAHYSPAATYDNSAYNEDKNHDQYLCTDSITTEKYVSSAYNDDIFQFSSTNIRQLLNHIQTEEQNHAEMIHKYKTVNTMS